MKYTDRTGQEYDFDRCSKAQLIAYAKAAMCACGRVSSGHDEGLAVLAAAEVPRESKADVARELAEYVLKNLGAPTTWPQPLNDRTANELREFRVRYSKAVAP